MSELPATWALVALDNVGSWGSGGTPPKGNSSYYEGNLPWAVIGDLDDGPLIKTERSISELGLKNSSAKLVSRGTILIAMYGSIGKLAITQMECCTNQAIAFCKEDGELADKKYLFYALLWARPELIKLGQGASQQNISQTILKAFSIPLAPRAEQTRIAQKLDELLAQVDTLKARIDAIPALLKRFRQSVLAAAVSGRLTEEWRAKSGSTDWRSVSWAEILKNSRDSFKRGPFGSALKKSMFVEKGYKVYEQYCPINDDCSFARYYITPEKYEEMKAFSVEPGDFLISCSGVSLGRITQVPADSEPGIINQALLRVRLNETLYSSEFFKVVFRSPTFQKELFENSTGSAIPNLKGVKELKAMLVPLPSLEEQTEIVRRVEQLFAFADQLEAKVATAQARIDRLTQSILAKAFRGELVPQDPNDEPASVLLECIKTQRATAPKAKRGRKASA